jgi:DNA-binding transcriptional regulator YhcF (GntR family)
MKQRPILREIYSWFNMVTLTIDRSLKDPVYEQVAAQIRQLVASGALAPGTLLPSVRQLANDLGVNLNTVARAYRLLKAEGFLIIKNRAGVSVAAPPTEIENTVKEELSDQLRVSIARLRQALRQAGLSPDELLELVQREIETPESRHPEEPK